LTGSSCGNNNYGRVATEMAIRMFSAYRTSVYAIASTASRRVYHNSARTLKASVDRPATVESAATKVASETIKNKASSSSWAKENPFLFQLGVATVKTSAADLVAQMVAERKSLDEVDWKRNAIFVVFGFAYLGGFQYWLMVNKYRQWFP
jgi:electron transfer flavoprotein alpha/beta subunit